MDKLKSHVANAKLKDTTIESSSDNVDKVVDDTSGGKAKKFPEGIHHAVDMFIKVGDPHKNNPHFVGSWFEFKQDEFADKMYQLWPTTTDLMFTNNAGQKGEGVAKGLQRTIASITGKVIPFKMVADISKFIVDNKEDIPPIPVDIVVGYDRRHCRVFSEDKGVWVLQRFDPDTKEWINCSHPETGGKFMAPDYLAVVELAEKHEMKVSHKKILFINKNKDTVEDNWLLTLVMDLSEMLNNPAPKPEVKEELKVESKKINLPKDEEDDDFLDLDGIE